VRVELGQENAPDGSHLATAFIFGHSP
jgi:hypothetical protein